MQGFLIFENKTGQLLYSKNYNQPPFTKPSYSGLDQSASRVPVSEKLSNKQTKKK